MEGFITERSNARRLAETFAFIVMRELGYEYPEFMYARDRFASNVRPEVADVDEIIKDEVFSFEFELVPGQQRPLAIVDITMTGIVEGEVGHRCISYTVDSIKVYDFEPSDDPAAKPVARYSGFTPICGEKQFMVRKDHELVSRPG